MEYNTIYNSYLLVDIAGLRANIGAILGGLPPKTKLIPVLKDNAFGVGLVRVAGVVSEFSEIETVAVAAIGEGVTLRRAGIDREILVMGGCSSRLNRLSVEQGLTLAVGRLGLVPLLAAEAKRAGKKARIEIKIETGLHRIGLLPGEELAALIAEIEAHRAWLDICGAFSHFADLSDGARTKTQHEQFFGGVEQLRAAGVSPTRLHLSGSAAFEHFPEYNLDAVRVGRRLYMDHPTEPLGGIKEIASWRSGITNLRKLLAGEVLGYGAGHRLKEDALIATVGVGYGDGLNQALVAAGAPVLVGGKRAKLAGCCMDQCFLDVTGIDCAVDDEVTFFGCDSAGSFLSSQEVALLAGGDEGCGLISALGGRVERIYDEQC